MDTHDAAGTTHALHRAAGPANRQLVGGGGVSMVLVEIRFLHAWGPLRQTVTFGVLRRCVGDLGQADHIANLSCLASLPSFECRQPPQMVTPPGRGCSMCQSAETLTRRNVSAGRPDDARTDPSGAELFP